MEILYLFNITIIRMGNCCQSNPLCVNDRNMTINLPLPNSIRINQRPNEFIGSENLQISEVTKNNIVN